MMCSGKIFCDIYRDKKYCRKDNREPNFKQCNCTHAVLKCDIGECAFTDRCPSFLQEKFDCMIRERFNGGLLNEKN